MAKNELSLTPEGEERKKVSVCYSYAVCACLKAVSDDIYLLTKIKEGGRVGGNFAIAKEQRIISAHSKTAYNMLFSLSLLSIKFLSSPG